MVERHRVAERSGELLEEIVQGGEAGDRFRQPQQRFVDGQLLTADRWILVHGKPLPWWKPVPKVSSAIRQMPK